MIQVSINRTCARLQTTEPLTSGMIGKQMQLVFDSSWNGLRKTAVFSDGKNTVSLMDSFWGDSNTITIPHEVLSEDGRTVTMGVYGYKVNGDETILAIPSVYAELGKVRKGADPEADPTADPTLPVYAQLEWKIDHFEVPEEQIATQVQEYLDEHPVEIQPATETVLGGIKVGDGLSVTPDGTLSADVTADDLGELADIVDEKLSDAPSDDKQYARRNGEWTEVQSGGGDAKAIGRACYNLLAKAVYTEDVTALMSALWALVGANLVSISAVFTQGATVIYPSTALDSLKTMLVVTAHYDDDTTAEVNDYTLSGVLTEGTSTITATYNGKTATFNVNVTAEPVIPVLDYISAVYTQSGEVYETTALDELKADLVVTAHLTDASTQTVDAADYTLSGTLAVGTSVVTVSYEDKTTTFNVTVSAIPVVTYSITNNLTNCSNSNAAVSINEGESYSATITADEGYELGSVVCLMGGVAQTVTAGAISIASVTGNIVITASAVVPTPTTQYALHQIAGYGGQFDTGLRAAPQHGAVAKIALTIDFPTASGTKVLISGVGGWIGSDGTNWKTNASTTLVADKTLSQVMGQGKQTVTFSGWAQTSTSNIMLNYSSASYNPEVTWYEIKMFNTADELVGDFKPTANVGEMYDSVSNTTRNFTTTTGLTVSEVTA